jgi:hypothetical protein
MLSEINRSAQSILSFEEIIDSNRHLRSSNREYKKAPYLATPQGDTEKSPAFLSFAGVNPAA